MSSKLKILFAGILFLSISIYPQLNFKVTQAKKEFTPLMNGENFKWLVSGGDSV